MQLDEAYNKFLNQIWTTLQNPKFIQNLAKFWTTLR